MNYAPLEKFLLQFYPFTPSQLRLICSLASERHYGSGDYFAEAGRVAREIGFVVSGVFRVCYLNKHGDDVTKYFVEESNFVVDLHSYQYQLPSGEYIQAVTDANVLLFSADAWQSLGQVIADWHQTESRIISRALLEKVSRLSPLVGEDAATRYQNFWEKFPTLVNRVPLSYLASYIGITQQSLSRIRKKLSR